MTWKELAELDTEILIAHWQALIDSKESLGPAKKRE